MRVLVDVDGILCEKAEIGNPSSMLTAKPIAENIKAVNRLYKLGHKVIIYTARRGTDCDDPVALDQETATLRWLVANRVMYHKVLFNKPWADYYVDDRAIGMGELLKVGE